MPYLFVGLEKNMLAEAALLQLKTACGQRLTVVQQDEVDDLEGIIEDVEVVVGSLPSGLLKTAVNLKWLQQWGAGADWLLTHPHAADMAFILTNASGVHPIPVAEHVFGLLLMLARNLHHALDAQRQALWVGNRWHISPDRLGAKKAAVSFGPQDVFELAGKTMIIVGLGAIGQRIAHLAHAFGMTVHAVRKRPFLTQPNPHINTIIPPEQLHQLLPQADVVVVTLPHTADTDKLFNATTFRAMSPTSIFINIGRGGTVNQPDLIAALQNGQIAAAALDVFEEEPLPPSSPLWTLDNVLLTSHYASITPHYNARAFEIFIDNLHRYLNGRSLRNVVNKKAGY